MKLSDIPKPIREQMMKDEFIFGNAFCLKENGKYKRIDPMKVQFKQDGTYEVLE